MTDLRRLPLQHPTMLLRFTPRSGTITVFQHDYLDSEEHSTDPEKAFLMVQDGTQLQRQLCSDFFTEGGHEQQWLLFGKDSLATIGTLTAGILGAASAGSTAIAWVGLSSAAGISGINIYERNFLFSEDDIQAVRVLTLAAVSVAQSTALSSNNYSFSSGVSALMDVQNVCEVQNILSMVRKAISKAQPVPVVTAAPAAPGPAPGPTPGPAHLHAAPAVVGTGPGYISVDIQ